MAELGWVWECWLAPGEAGAEVRLRGALRALSSPQEDCEFYLTAQQFIVLPMQRQRMESSDGYGPWDGWLGALLGGTSSSSHSRADAGSPDVTCLWQGPFERGIVSTAREKEDGDLEGISNWLLSCCRNQDPSVVKKIKELWL